ncbi:MAG: hypothetical protein ABW125_03810 [Candidatus Thiodiazotropha lotti]
METALSASAIIISLISLGVSVFVALRDRAKLNATCEVRKHDETGEYSHIYIKAVNVGRRPITLSYLMGIYTENEKAGYLLENGGAKLEEGAFLERCIGKFDGMMIHTGRFGEKDCELEDLYFEDSAGNQYPVNEAKECVTKLWKSKHPLGVRTHFNS